MKTKHLPAFGLLAVLGLLAESPAAGPAEVGADPLFVPDHADRPVPGAETGGMTIHVEADRTGRGFHVTFEKDDGGHYVYFDGEAWGSTLRVTTDEPFRSGIHMAAGPGDEVHLAWVNGPQDRGGTLKYARIEGGFRSEVEEVHRPQGWNECDIALDPQGRILIAANTETQKQMAVYERGPGGWTRTVLPRAEEIDRWAPSIVTTEGGRVFVAFRRKDHHPFTWQVFEDGAWSAERTGSRSYEPDSIAVGEGLIAASTQGRLYTVMPDGKGGYETTSADFGGRVGIIRGQHVSVARTAIGTLYLAHSDMTNPDSKDRTIRPGHRFFYSMSSDLGATWRPNNRVTDDDSGQGHGSLAANGSRVMMVWPDMRGGRTHVRYTMLDEAPPNR